MKKRTQNEVKIGLLILACIAILLIFTFAVGNFSGIEKTYALKASFNSVAGLEKFAPVRLRGVDVGEVKDIKFTYDDEQTKILLTLAMKDNAKVREGAKAQISMLGLMGEKYVEIADGQQGNQFVTPGTLLPGEDPVGMEELMNAGKKLAAEVDKTIPDIRAFIKHLDNTIVENRKDIDFMIDKFKQVAINFEEFSDDIRRHPWKLLKKTKEKKRDDKKDDDRDDDNRRF